MFCSKCGSKLPEGAAFCGNCGSAVASPAERGAAPVASGGGQTPPSRSVPAHGASQGAVVEKKSFPVIPVVVAVVIVAALIVAAILTGGFGLAGGQAGGQNGAPIQQGQEQEALAANTISTGVVSVTYPNGWSEVDRNDLGIYGTGSGMQCAAASLGDVDDYDSSTIIVGSPLAVDSSMWMPAIKEMAADSSVGLSAEDTQISGIDAYVLRNDQRDDGDGYDLQVYFHNGDLVVGMVAVSLSQDDIAGNDGIIDQIYQSISYNEASTPVLDATLSQGRVSISYPSGIGLAENVSDTTTVASYIDSNGLSTLSVSASEPGDGDVTSVEEWKSSVSSKSFGSVVEETPVNGHSAMVLRTFSPRTGSAGFTVAFYEGDTIIGYASANLPTTTQFANEGLLDQILASVTCS